MVSLGRVGFNSGFWMKWPASMRNSVIVLLRKVKKALWTLKGKKLAVLGLAFKNGTDDIRESPAVAIVKALLKEGCTVTAYDPAAMKRASEEFPDGSVKFAVDAYEAIAGADALPYSY